MSTTSILQIWRVRLVQEKQQEEAQVNLGPITTMIHTLMDHYLAWKHDGPKELAGNHIFHIGVIGVFCNSDSLEYKQHVNMIQKADESANVALLCVWLLGCLPSQPHIAIRLWAVMDLHGNYMGLAQHVHLRDYFIPCTEVERFKDEVQDRPGEAAREKWFTTCTDNWTAAKAIKENQIQVFKQTECIAEMKQSGELMKYELAAVSWLLNICGEDQAVGHDVFWVSKKMIASSSLRKEVQEKWLKVVVNAFHRFTHNHLCQLENHPLYQVGFGNEDLETCEHIFSSSNNMALLICHTSEFHWKKFLDLHFSQWDSNKYLELSGQFLYNNYKQVLCIIQTHLAELEQFKCSKDITDNDFKSWNWEELEYLKQCVGESDATLIMVQYVELLEKLNFVEETYGSITQVPYLTYTPAEFTSTAGLNESTWQGMNVINSKYASTLQKYQLQLNVMANFKHQHNIINHWTPLHHEYINACEYTKHHAFIWRVGHPPAMSGGWAIPTI
ncbi:hypothetical protein EDC04DRAFT_2603673 [Pisolithus marmoratus]|nr:hypothetical protein EDC04DRAFT_2603673 [Pisolithus marmoratus]